MHTYSTYILAFAFLILVPDSALWVGTEILEQSLHVIHTPWVMR